MRRKLFLTSVFAALLPLSAQANVTLHLNENVELLAYNGKSHHSAIFGSDDVVALSDGTQQIAFRYVDSFDEGKDVTFVRSDVLVIKFDANNTDIFFHLPQFQTKRQARLFNKNPEFALKDGSDNIVPFEQGKLTKSGFQLTRDYVSELEYYNLSDKPASLQLTPKATVKAVSHEVKPQNTTQTVGISGETINEVEYQLHYWFNKADAETKARFKAFINTQ